VIVAIAPSTSSVRRSVVDMTADRNGQDFAGFRGNLPDVHLRRPALGLTLALVLLTSASAGLAHEPHVRAPDPARPELAQHDLEKGSRHGSPLDALPPHITEVTLPPEVPNAMRADWSPDGRRLVFLDALIGNAWEYDLAHGRARNLTGRYLPGGVLRAHHLSNGDLLLCAPPSRDVTDPEDGRFRGELWVMTRPLGTSAPVRGGGADERCWEGVAVSKAPGSTRIAWARSAIDFTAVPGVFVQAATGQSQIMTGRIAYGRAGVPSLVDVALAVDRADVGPDAIVEPQDYRFGDRELVFSAYFHRGGEVMAIDLPTGRITDQSRSPWYEEPEGIDPDGRFVLVERDLAVVVFPGELDIWRLTLDGSGTFERLTTFNHFEGFGATNPVVSPAGDRFAFQLEEAGGGHGAGSGLLLFDLAAWDAAGPHPAGPDPFLLPPR
jgi:hypothetical protein